MRELSRTHMTLVSDVVRTRARIKSLWGALSRTQSARIAFFAVHLDPSLSGSELQFP
jgi:hypothetical protein